MSRGPTPAFRPPLHAEGPPPTGDAETAAFRDLIQGAVAAACTLLIVFTVLAWSFF